MVRVKKQLLTCFLRSSSLSGSSTLTLYLMSFSLQMRGSYSSGMMMSRKRPPSW